MGIFSTFTKAFARSSDAFTPPPYFPMTWWQQDFPTDRVDAETNSTVQACVRNISESIAQLPIKHYRVAEDGTRIELRNSAVARVMRQPNPFMTRSELLIFMLRSVLLEGNGYCVAQRNKRYEIEALYPQQRMNPAVSFDNQDVYYFAGTSELLDVTKDEAYPSRDVWHLKLFSHNHILKGESVISYGLKSIAVAESIQSNNAAFFKSASKPSFVLSTDVSLTSEQSAALRKRFAELTSGANQGGVPVLSSGLKPIPLASMNARDAALIEAYSLSREDIAALFRVPMLMLGQVDSSTGQSNTEAIMQLWLSNLRFIIEQVEASLTKLFNLPADEIIDIDTTMLVPQTPLQQNEADAKAVLNGIMTPNEVRSRRGLKPMDGGGELLAQQQVIPLVQSQALAQQQAQSPKEFKL